MNPSTLKEAVRLFGANKRLAKIHPNLVFEVFVPAPFLHPLSTKNKDETITMGAQNIYIKEQGSYTGAISFAMVKDAGAGRVLIGHSERRELFGVSDETVQKKVNLALEHGMPMTVCFGEHNRDNKGNYTEEIERQLSYILEPFRGTKKATLLTLAYEPVWAIGAAAKRPVTEDELFSTIILIRNVVAKYVGEHRSREMTILYGGSVNADNALSLSKVPGVDGFLIGRASLDSASLKQIAQAVS